MKKLFVGMYMSVCLALPASALNPAALERALTAPINEPVFSIYAPDTQTNSRRAVRLGYKNFQARVNTPNMTPNDIQIGLLITTGFKSFFDKLNKLEVLPEAARQEQVSQLQEEFNNLVKQLAQLLSKNQFRYTNPFFMEDKYTLLETLLIVQEALDKGTF